MTLADPPLPALQRIVDALIMRLGRVSGQRAAQYTVPGLWLDPFGPVAAHPVIPEQFFLDALRSIMAQPAQGRVCGDQGPGDWGQYAIAYNLFVRAGAAWDHDGDGEIALEPRADGWRETGTFLKAITLLPFIRSLGCNTVHLLPITSIGQDGHKGNLGSPFAIRDPMGLDERQSEPALGLGAEAEFAAFVEAAHHLGLRVVVEFVFRTAAKDAAWAGEHPEWFYWIRADVPDRSPGELSETLYGAPLFSPSELEQIYRQVGTGRLVNLLPPHEVYRRMFLPPPRAEDVQLIDGRWVGRVHDSETGEWVRARIPGAFSDWTPDSDQPPWTDVTYFRLYDHPDFNYMAYNTLRMYDVRLAQPKNAVGALWDAIVEVIPHYQQAYDIDGVMIDMGHALPPPLKQRLVARARELNPDFALWAEDFQLKPGSRAEGYNVCLGPFLQTVRDPARLRSWLGQLHQTGVPVPFMGTPENHNTPRAVTWPGGLDYARYAMTVGACLPSVPYVHGGLELAETHPVNTGFDFTAEQLAALPASMLPLFSASAYDWAREANLVGDLRRILAFRHQHAALLSDPEGNSIAPVDSDNESIIAFMRGRKGQLRLLVACNSNMHVPRRGALYAGWPVREPVDLLTGQRFDLTGTAPTIALAPGQVAMFAMDGEAE